MRLIPSVALFALLASPFAAMADTFNPASSFPSLSGPFSYGYGTPGGGLVDITTFTSANYNQNTPFDASGNPNGYYTYNSGGLPAVGVGPIGDGTVSVPTGDLFMHPGNSAGQASIVIFTAATAGEYDLNGSFSRADTSDGSGFGTTDAIYLNNGTSLFSAVLPNAPYGTTASFDESVYLNAGDSVDFTVNTTGGNVYYNDSTALALNVTQTPEPSSMVLLGTGLLAVAGFGRRKFLKA